MSTTVLVPTRPAIRKRFGWKWLPVAAVFAVVIAAMVARPWSKPSNPAVQGTFYTVVPMDLEIKIIKDGELQAIEYTDIKSGVESYTSILELIKEGTTAKKGDRLVVLDSSALVLRKEELDLSLQKAEAALKISIEMKEIQESQNAATIDAIDVTIQLAELELREWQDGTYPQQKQNAETARKMSEIMLKTKLEDQEQTQRLFAKGFVTAADVKKAELDVTVAKNDLQQKETALKVLTEYQAVMDKTRLESALAQAKLRKTRILRENRSFLSQRLADVAEKEAYVENLKERTQKLADQIEACTIKAPEDGLVIYSSTIDRWGRDQVQEGTQVREKQWLLRLPDVRAMKAVLRIPEAQVAKLDVNRKQPATVRIVGQNRGVGATLTKVSVLPDSSSRWWNPDLKEYPVELTLHETPPNLKPGVGCQAEIFIDSYPQTLAVPLAALYTVGKDTYVFIRQGQEVNHRKITVGASNETHVQVTEGLTEGEEVMLLQASQGRTLLEAAGIKVEATTRPASENGRRNRRSEGSDRR